MKKILVLFGLSLFFCCLGEPVDLRVMTFNIRYDNPSDSLNGWAYRKDVVADVIRASGIDLLGTQEVLVHQLNDLKERLPEYQVVGVGREDGKEKGEYSAVFYRKDRFEALDSGWFWLSETPQVAGSKGWDGACERIATWVILKEKTTGRALFFINTHLDHVGTVARRESVALILGRVEALSKGLPVIVSGDFNATPDSEVFHGMTASGGLHHARALSEHVSGLSGTFHDFGRIAPEDRPLIDYIFLTDDFTVQTYEALPEKRDNVYVSDHVPVVVNIKLK